jgi:membrane-associated protease RseP (regulator of RpoE activity)
MNTQRTWNWSAMALAAVAMIAFSASPVWARGGGHGGGGGMHGGGHANPHPYHPSQSHFAHHADGQHGDYNHHHNDWHNGNWGPGYWGGAAVGYGLGAAYAPWAWGGYDDTIDDDEDVTPVYNDPDYATVDDMNGVYEGDDDADTSDDSSDDLSSAPNTAASSRFPTDAWPELGITTYAGEYGGSQGQVVVRIVPGSAAAKAGFVPGDVILSLNGQPTPSADAMEQFFASASGKFSAEVWDARTGRTSTLSGDLDANSAPAPSSPTAAVSQQ